MTLEDNIYKAKGSSHYLFRLIDETPTKRLFEQISTWRYDRKGNRVKEWEVIAYEIHNKLPNGEWRWWKTPMTIQRANKLFKD